MKRRIFGYLAVGMAVLASCSPADKLIKVRDYDYKYEAAKQLYVEGKYSSASMLLADMIPMFKGTDRGEESLYLLAMCNYKMGDYVTASQYFKKYYSTYVSGQYAELARFYSGKSLYYCTVDPRLDQSETITAITELQNFMDNHPLSAYRQQARDMIFELQDRLVEKEYLSSKLYYDLGSYMGNCTFGGSNYEACVVTAQNALKDYPYTKRKEDFAMLVLKAKYGLAMESVEAKKAERFRDVLDEAYGFKNQYPDSKNIKEVDRMLKTAEQKVKGLPNEDANS